MQTDCLEATDFRASPNFDDRVGGGPDLIVLHYTATADGEKALNWLTSSDSKVSSHYFVFEDGRIVQSVSESKRAWHAGISSWKTETDLNSRSIGIEISNSGDTHYPDVQIQSVCKLVGSILKRHNIVPERILGHSDISPGRKIDPGRLFPWHKLWDAGIGLWVKPVAMQDGRFFQPGDNGQPIEALQSMLALYGYKIPLSGVFDDATFQVVCSFQMHFRQQRVDGIADTSTIATLYALCSALPDYSS